MSNPLVELGKAGQSIWYDQMERALLTRGTLQRMIEQDDLRGLTSNPTIFEKAIGGSSDYDEALETLARRGADRDAIYEALVLDDIGRAADLFRPVWERTEGADGFVSLEVSPLLAHDTIETVEQALRLHDALSRPNVMIKVPATPPGIPAIEELIAAGININITLIFSRAVYEQVIEAYLRGLEKRMAAGGALDRVASVASFFVSRIDTKADAALRKKIEATSDPSARRELESLLGKVAIANAKLAYQLFHEKFSGPRWEPLAAAGAMVQRPLWASTGTKDPSYSDVLYIEALIGPQTVNTIPPKTYDAFKDHGNVRLTLEEGLDEAHRTLERLEASGISLEKITTELTVEGVKSFSDSFDSLMKTIESRRMAAERGVEGREVGSLGKAQARVDEALANLDRNHVLDRIWRKDASLWKDDPSHRAIIENSLGWLNVPEWTLEHEGELASFAEAARKDFDFAVVLGMGGSSLCSEVLRTSFGRRPGWPELLVLDSTVPAAVAALERSIEMDRTLFIVASKSGTTTEPLMFQRYFWERVRARRGDETGRSFVAITDPGTALQKEAERDGYRKIFLNPPDIGGRYSALSLFGMVPAAVAGIDVKALLERAVAAARAASAHGPIRENAGARLGATLGALALEGRDKLTIVTSRTFSALGLWIEQLVAESTGKEGKGILPIAHEPLEAPRAYGDDRVFVRIRLASEEDDETSERLHALAEAGHPVLERVLRDPLDLGEELFVWELATAVAGWFLKIDPFDQPNVQESKDNTKRLLEEARASGSLPLPKALAEYDGVTLSGDAKWSGGETLGEALGNLFASARPGYYIALLEYVRETPRRNEILRSIRGEIVRSLAVATTSGYGPRFLHSTGQFHKGGGDNGIFLQITGDEGADVPIPGETFGFATLAAAQALGDFQALASRGRRALRLHLDDVDGGLERIREAVGRAVAVAGR